MSSLFTTDFIESISALRLNIRQVARGGRHADHRSADLGNGLEFRDYRCYQPGDDFRRIDWNLYLRTGKLFLRLYEQAEDLPVYIMLDTSDSMYFENPPRADAARQTAGVFAAVALNHHDRVSIFPFVREPSLLLKRGAGPATLPRLLHHLENLKAGGPGDFAGAVHRFSIQSRRSGLAVVISDFFDHAGVDKMVEALSKLRHQVLLVPVIRSVDRNPEIGGMLRLVDCETSHPADIAVSPLVLQQYRQAYDTFFDQLKQFARTSRAGYFELSVDKPVLGQIRRLFEQSAFTA